MKRLVLTQITKEDEEGGTSTKHVLVIQGEETEYTSNTVAFRPYEHQIKLIARDPSNPTTVTCETVFVEGVRKGLPIPDSLGGNACGRSFPAWNEGRPFTKAEQTENRLKAGYYGFLFGEATFPGKAPVVVNLRMTSTVNQDFNVIEKTLGRDRGGWPTHLIELKASKQDNPVFSKILFTTKQSGLDKGDTAVSHEITEYIEEHNSNIKNKG